VRRAFFILLAVAGGGCHGTSPPAALAPPTVIATSAWNASGALGLEPAPAGDPNNPSRPGDTARPRSLAAVPDKLVILDEANQRLAELPLAGNAGLATLDASADYAGASDLVFDAQGALWVLGPASCQCARQLTGTDAQGTDVAIAPELFPGRLAVSGATLAIESFDGAHPLFDGGAAVSIADQRDRVVDGVRHPVLGLSLAADLPDPPGTTVHLVGRDGGGNAVIDTLVDVGAAPDRVVALGAGCRDAIVLAVQVLGAGGLSHVVTTLDRTGHPLAQGSTPAPSNPFGLFRGFALSSDGSLYQLRPEEDHYDVVRWPTGC